MHGSHPPYIRWRRLETPIELNCLRVMEPGRVAGSPSSVEIKQSEEHFCSWPGCCSNNSKISHLKTETICKLSVFLWLHFVCIYCTIILLDVVLYTMLVRPTHFKDLLPSDCIYAVCANVPCPTLLWTLSLTTNRNVEFIQRIGLLVINFIPYPIHYLPTCFSN